MNTLSYRTIVKSALFVIVGVVAAALVMNTLRVPVHGPSDEYILVFTDAEGLVDGNPVKMSGVRIGRVDGVSLDPQDDGTALARVRVRVESGHPLPEHVRASIRYGDMLGARYIAIDDAGPDGPERDGNTVTAAATTPPVNLTALMNGFQPLFASLDPQQVNELAQGFVDTFAGRTKSVNLLLSQIAKMGSNLSTNSAVFARLVANLDTLMGNADQRSGQLKELFAGLGQLTTAIVGDQGRLTSLFDSGDRAIASLAQMMTVAGDDFARSITGLRDVTGAWIPQTEKFETFLAKMPVMADRINHSGRYGGFMSLYMCNFTLKAGPAEVNLFGSSHSQMCR
ncbi:MlaD family protein [Gordonia neofelifaecis]|uniref:Virulence factor Mce family protein n=1 Tax=Gordonia neofelifaecis NRRL B-59395 TaxID=644548 RepID=F1YKY3_9ACTN|nr:MCE family protein [Gordonia neofelifaecis]EGD54777.1 virulence factor Mce family protein [Gordonia neofelifaecis NRRL B-59395]